MAVTKCNAGIKSYPNTAYIVPPHRA